MTKAVIIYGPQGSGKTRHAEALRVLFGKAQVIEAGDLPRYRGFYCNGPMPDDALVLTCDIGFAEFQRGRYGACVCDIDAALQALEFYTARVDAHDLPGDEV